MIKFTERFPWHVLLPKKLKNNMLISPTVYEMLNDNVTLYTRTDTVPSLVCNVDIKNENDPRMWTKRLMEGGA